MGDQAGLSGNSKSTADASFCSLLKGESDNHGRRKVGNEIEIGRYIKGTEKKQKKNR